MTSNLGRVLFVIANLIYSVGAFIADFSVTHVYNPTWRPHAKFHNGQTMTLGAMLSIVSIALVFLPAADVNRKKEQVLLATIIGSLYCSSGFFAAQYPGAAWADPEYETSVPGAQGYIFAAQLVMIWSAYRLEIGSLNKTKIS